MTPGHTSLWNLATFSLTSRPVPDLRPTRGDHHRRGASPGRSARRLAQPVPAYYKLNSKRTLTNLYNARQDWLAVAHQRLDPAVFDAHGWPHDLNDKEMLAQLLALNLTWASNFGSE